MSTAIGVVAPRGRQFAPVDGPSSILMHDQKLTVPTAQLQSRAPIDPAVVTVYPGGAGQSTTMDTSRAWQSWLYVALSVIVGAAFLGHAIWFGALTMDNTVFVTFYMLADHPSECSFAESYDNDTFVSSFSCCYAGHENGQWPVWVWSIVILTVAALYHGVLTPLTHGLRYLRKDRYFRPVIADAILRSEYAGSVRFFCNYWDPIYYAFLEASITASVAVFSGHWKLYFAWALLVTLFLNVMVLKYLLLCTVMVRKMTRFVVLFVLFALRVTWWTLILHSLHQMDDAQNVTNALVALAYTMFTLFVVVDTLLLAVMLFHGKSHDALSLSLSGASGAGAAALVNSYDYYIMYSYFFLVLKAAVTVLFVYLAVFGLGKAEDGQLPANAKNG